MKKFLDLISEEVQKGFEKAGYAPELGRTRNPELE